MRIVRLEANNILRLKAVEIRPDGSLVVIGGRNGAGKSSLLSAITMALGGKRSVPPEPVRRGARNAEVVVELDDLVVTRKFSKSGSTLKVAGKDGAAKKSPQAILDKLVGTLSFDPLEFSRMDPGKQLETLKTLVGLDFSEMDRDRQALYDRRTGINRDLGTTKSQLREAPHHMDTLTDEVSIADLTVELDRRREANAANEKGRQELETLRKEAALQKENIQRLEVQLEEARNGLAEIVATGKELAAIVGDLQDEDLEEIREQIAGAEEANRKVRENARYAELEAQLDAHQALSEGLTAEIDDIDREKEVAISTANMPIEGLGLGENGVTLNDLPLEQASGAEQLRVSVAIGLALNPELRVLLVRDGSLLDEGSLRMVAEMAAERDAQVWMERVGEGDETSVIIEDGMVKEPVAAEGEAA